MRYPQEFIERVRAETDLVELVSSYLPLKQKGSSYFGLCPFHHEHTPSFSVSRDKQLYYCFGCGAAGNVFGFVMQMENCGFPEALKLLAERANIPMPAQEMTWQEREEESLRERLYEMHRAAGRFFYDALQAEEGMAARNYLEQRRVSLPIQRKFGLGYCPKDRTALTRHLKQLGYREEEMKESGLVIEGKHGLYDRFSGRLMFPIMDWQSRIIGFGGRILDRGEPKYLNSPETKIFQKKKNLYGISFARKAKKDTILLVEGYMDMITIYQAGFPFVVASLGTAFHQDHANLLKKVAKEVILLFDSDEAGERAALRAIPILVGNGFTVKVLQVPMGKDPDQFIKEHGSAAFGRLLVEAKHYLAFQLDCIRKKYDLNSLEQKLQFTKEAAVLLARLSSPIEQDVYAREIAAKTGVDLGAIQTEMRARSRKEAEDFARESEKQRRRAYQDAASLQERQKAKGLQDAQGTILSVLSGYPAFLPKIAEMLHPDDFLDETYRRLAEAVYAQASAGQRADPAALVSLFDTAAEQEKAAAAFARPLPQGENGELEKAVNEALQLVKRTAIEVKSASVTDVQTLQELLAERKKLERFSVRL